MTDTNTPPVALVTGANKGIGFEIARGLGQKGITVLLGCRDPERGAEAARKLEAEGIDARPIHLDVTTPHSLAKAAQAIEAAHGKLDILVNNAGISALERGMEAQNDPAVIRLVFETNVMGPIIVTQAMLPLLRQAEAGRVVNVTSGMGSLTLLSNPDEPWSAHPAMAYAVSKTAANAATVQLANILRGTPIKVNAVCPGYCATDLNGHSGPRTPAEGARAAVIYALIGEDGPTAGFFNEDGPMAW